MNREEAVPPPLAVARKGELRFVILCALAFASLLGWLISEREPTENEMMFAYRKYLVAICPDQASKAVLDVRQQVHKVALTKQRCDKLDNRRYRCEAIVATNDVALEHAAAAANAIYIRDGKGWQFESINHE